MKKGFMDTGPWFEYSIARDQKLYRQICDNLSSTQYQWHSSTYVFDELMTLLVSKVNKSKAISFGEKIRNSQLISWLHPTPEDERKCWDIFKSYHDKEWSYTDCMSLFLIQKYKIDFVYSFDHHFPQMGLKVL